MKITDYIKRKTIQLPSGASAVVRPFRQMDFNGNIPAIIAQRKARGLNGTDSDGLPTPESVAYGVEIMKIALTKCASIILESDAGKETRFSIVDGAAKDGQISIGDISNEDATAILAAVQEISGMTKEAVESARSFPQVEASASNGGSTGAAVQVSAN